MEKKCTNCEEIHSNDWNLTKELAKNNKRMFIVMIVVLCMWLATIAGFIWYLNQYDFESVTEITATQDGGGNNIVGGGDITYGANSENTEKENTKEEK